MNQTNVAGLARPSTGVYCIDVAVPILNVVATVQGTTATYISASLGTTTGCPAGTDVVIRTWNSNSTPQLVSTRSFYVLFN